MSILKQIGHRETISTDLSGFFGVLPHVTDYLCL